MIILLPPFKQYYTICSLAELPAGHVVFKACGNKAWSTDIKQHWLRAMCLQLVCEGRPHTDLLTDYDATGADQADLFLQGHPGASLCISPHIRPGVWGLRLAVAAAAAAPLPRTLGHPEAPSSVSHVFCGPGDKGDASLPSLPICKWSVKADTFSE